MDSFAITDTSVSIANIRDILLIYVKVGQQEFRDYMTAHNGRILLPIVLPSIAAFISSLLLLWQRPVEIPSWSVWLVNAANAATLLWTIFVQGKAHQALADDGYSEILIRRIITASLCSGRNVQVLYAFDNPQLAMVKGGDSPLDRAENNIGWGIFMVLGGIFTLLEYSGLFEPTRRRS
jgi:hypothetical protein